MDGKSLEGIFYYFRDYLGWMKLGVGLEYGMQEIAYFTGVMRKYSISVGE